ncbi:MAG: EAL domain-containing protein [Sulfuricurvum sp.]|nr:EAL domain-containing protein [Sulfuricurvum sp.]MDD5387103.1 EAL domain-containing protein [Sulfuricurvum sp.]
MKLSSLQKELLLTFVLPVIAPFGTLIVQTLMWDYFQPFVWFLFYPTVFFMAWIGGMRGALISSLISALIVLWFFIPPAYSFNKTNIASYLSVLVFIFLGYAFGLVQQKLKNANSELSKFNDKLKEMDRLKTEFFSNISHEFRTPLTLMLTPAEELLSKPQNLESNKITSNIEIIHRNALRLLKLVNILLDFSRIEAGRAKAAYEATDLSALTADLASNFSSASELSDLKLIIDCPPMSEWVEVDRDMWEKIVLNLLSNAFKFTHHGTIRVSTRSEAGKAVLRVEDTGIGIPEEAHSKLFERFYRVENSQGRSYEGTGIGLSLVQELVKLQNGTIEVTSKVGEGTIFTVYMPLGIKPSFSEKKQSESIESKKLPQHVQTYMAEATLWSSENKKDKSVEIKKNIKGHILIADDNADMREFIKRLLEDAGYSVSLAVDGEDAWEMCQKNLPDLVLSDVMMPKLNGFEFLKKIRSAEYTYSLPIILISARAGEVDKVEGLMSGADDYLSKPFYSGELIARVEGAVKLGKYRKQAYEQLLSVTNHIAKIGGWSFDVATLMGEWTDELIRIHDLPPNTPIDVNKGLNFYTQQSRPIIEKAVQDVINFGKPYDLQLEIITAIGAHKWVRTVGAPVIEDGKVVKVQGVMQDITELKLSEIESQRNMMKYQKLFESSLDALMTYFPSTGKFTKANKATLKLFGAASEAEFLAVGPANVSPPLQSDGRPSDEKVREMIAIAVEEGSNFFEWTHMRLNGEVFDADVQLTRVNIEGEEPFVQATVRDITKRKQMELKLLKHKTIFENIAEGVYAVDIHGRCTYINNAGLKLLGFNENEVVGYIPHDVFHYRHNNDGPYFINECPINFAVLAGKTTRLEEYFIRKDGSAFPVYVTVSPIVQEDTVIGSVITFEDIAQQKEDQNKIIIEKERFDHLAHYDELTELPNRLSLNEFMEIRFSENNSLAFMFLDLDGFKEINDSYGHGFGDKLLVEVSKMLSDTFPKNSYIVRTGGDEFVIVVPCQGDKSLIDTTMENISGMFNNPFSINEKDIYVTASIGIAMYPYDAQSTEELLKCADAAMYNAKKLGKNTFSFYNSALTEQVLYRMTITTNLKKALSNHELELYFQPQVNPNSGLIVGTEALLRWFSPQGSISPTDFIPIAEESGLILEIGEFVLIESFKTAKRWFDSNLLMGRIAVNISAHQITHSNFVALLERILKETQCQPKWIELEITERFILSDPEKVILLLGELCAKGFHVSIDDFGTGYSSLSYLKNLPVNKLKIDISFIRNITNEPKNQTIVKAIIALAKGLEMEVLAEGVESSEEMEFLRMNGIDSIQGYYYYKPLSIEIIENLPLNF